MKRVLAGETGRGVARDVGVSEETIYQWVRVYREKQLQGVNWPFEGRPVRPARPPEQLFFAKVDKTEACWLWLASKNAQGYGIFRTSNKTFLAHRWIYQQNRGELPLSMQLDHLCRVRSCVNPDHLEPVTPYENFVRGNHTSAQVLRTGLCKNGHPVSTYVDVETGRTKTTSRCDVCKREKDRRWRLAHPKPLREIA